MADTSGREQRLTEAIAAYLEAADAGRAPDRADLLAHHPDLAGELAAFLDNRERVAAVALRAEQRQCWHAGQRVPAEDYLRRLPGTPPDPEAALDLIVQEFLLRERAGARPDPDEFLRRFPEHAAVLRDQLSLHRALVASDTVGDAPGDRAADDPEAAVTIDAPVGAAGAAAAPPGTVRYFGDYELLGEVARGGM